MAWLRREEKEGEDGRVREVKVVKVVEVEVEVRSGMRIEWLLERTRHCSTPPPVTSPPSSSSLCFRAFNSPLSHFYRTRSLLFSSLLYTFIPIMSKYYKTIFLNFN